MQDIKILDPITGKVSSILHFSDQEQAFYDTITGKKIAIVSPETPFTPSGSTAVAGYFAQENGVTKFYPAEGGSAVDVTEIRISDTGKDEPDYGSQCSGVLFNGGVTSATSVQVMPADYTKDWTSFYGMFMDCGNLVTLNGFNTSNGTDFADMFMYCNKLTTIPAFDTSKGTKFNNMFYYCNKLATVPQLDVSNGTDFSDMFFNCASLINFGGLMNCKKSYSLEESIKLTHASLLNALNGLATVTTQQTLTLGEDNLAKLTDAEKAIATAKGWTLA